MSGVILLTHDSDAARIIANRVHRRVGLAAIAIEDSDLRGPLPSPLGLKPLTRWIIGPGGYQLVASLQRSLTGTRRLNAEQRAEQKADQALDEQLRDIERRLEADAMQELAFEAGDDARDWPQGPPRKRFRRMNDDDCLQWCTDFSPELSLVYGTGILRKPILSIAKLGSLNVHSALLPDYRGTRSEFFQVHDQQLDKAGVTIHFVNEQVDEGALVLQQAANPPADINPYQLRRINVLIASELMPEAAAQVLSGEARPKRQGESSTPTFRARDITLEKRRTVLERLDLI